jgi:hypothetical protein
MASGEEEGLFDFLPEQAAPERVGGGLPRLRFAERMQTRWRPVIRRLPPPRLAGGISGST